MKREEETPENIDPDKDYPFEAYEVKKIMPPGALVINFVKKS